MNAIFSPSLRLSAAILLMLLFSACGSHFAQTETQPANECWAAGDTLDLNFENTDTAQAYQLYFPITFTEDYPYNNLYLRAVVKAPSGEEHILPARFDLAAPTGEWFSDPSGDEIPFTLNIGEGLRFNQTGTYTIRLYHYMRDNEVCGVRKIGVVVDPLGA
jgi:gliding motility-associated lipoprotein GldH